MHFKRPETLPFFFAAPGGHPRFREKSHFDLRITAAGGAAASGGAGVNIENLTVGFDAKDASSQVAAKLQPMLVAQHEQQQREFAGQAKQKAVAQRIGGRA